MFKRLFSLPITEQVAVFSLIGGAIAGAYYFGNENGKSELSAFKASAEFEKTKAADALGDARNRITTLLSEIETLKARPTPDDVVEVLAMGPRSAEAQLYLENSVGIDTTLVVELVGISGAGTDLTGDFLVNDRKISIGQGQTAQFIGRDNSNCSVKTGAFNKDNSVSVKLVCLAEPL